MNAEDVEENKAGHWTCELCGFENSGSYSNQYCDNCGIGGGQESIREHLERKIDERIAVAFQRYGDNMHNDGYGAIDAAYSVATERRSVRPSEPKPKFPKRSEVFDCEGLLNPMSNCAAQYAANRGKKYICADLRGRSNPVRCFEIDNWREDDNIVCRVSDLEPDE